MNSLLKAEVKKGSYAEVGAKLDDMRESCEKDVRRYEGAISALAEAAKRVTDLLAHVDKDFDDGKLVLQDANQTRAMIKRWIQRCSGVCENLKDAAVTKQLQATGKVASLEQSIRFVKTLYDAEVGKIKAIEEHNAGGVPVLGHAPQADSSETNVVSITRRPSRPTGVHPGPSAASLRRAEEKSEAESAETVKSAESTAASTPAAETVDETEALQTEQEAEAKGDATTVAEAAADAVIDDTERREATPDVTPTGLPAVSLQAPSLIDQTPAEDTPEKKPRRRRKKAQ